MTYVEILNRAAAYAKRSLQDAQAQQLKNGILSLNLLYQYLRKRWNKVHGTRELVQNYLDGLVMLLKGIGINDPCIQHVLKIDRSDRLHIVSYFVRRRKVNDGGDDKEDNHNDVETCFELGYILFRRNGKTGMCRLELVNRYVALTTNILRIGKTNKSRGSGQAGGFGEGLKVGILALMRDKVRVRYFTAATQWEFLFKKIGTDRVLYVRTLKHNNTKNIKSDCDTYVVLDWEGESYGELFDRSMFPALSNAFMKPEKRAEFVLPLNTVLHCTDVRNPYLLFGEQDIGAVYVSLIRVCEKKDFLVGVGYSDPNLHAYLGRDRNQIMNYRIGQKFGPHVTNMLRARALSTAHADYIYTLVERLPQKGGAETVWDYMLLYYDAMRDPDAKWTDFFVERFRQKYGPEAYPCSNPLEEAIIRRELGRHPVCVSQCLHNLLVYKPHRSGYRPVEEAARLAFVESPTVPIQPLLLRQLDTFVRAVFEEASNGDYAPCETPKEFIIAHDTRSRRTLYLHFDQRARRVSLRIPQRLLDILAKREATAKKEEEEEVSGKIIPRTRDVDDHDRRDERPRRRFPPLVQLLFSLLSALVNDNPTYLHEIDESARMRLTERMYDLADNVFRDAAYYRAIVIPMTVPDDDDHDDDARNKNRAEEKNEEKSKEKQKAERKAINDGSDTNYLFDEDDTPLGGSVGAGSDACENSDAGGVKRQYQQGQQQEEYQQQQAFPPAKRACKMGGTSSDGGRGGGAGNGDNASRDDFLSKVCSVDRAIVTKDAIRIHQDQPSNDEHDRDQDMHNLSVALTALDSVREEQKSSASSSFAPRTSWSEPPSLSRCATLPFACARCSTRSFLFKSTKWPCSGRKTVAFERSTTTGHSSSTPPSIRALSTACLPACVTS